MRKPNKITSDLVRQTFYPKSSKPIHYLADTLEWFLRMRFATARLGYTFKDNKFKCWICTPECKDVEIIA